MQDVFLYAQKPLDLARQGPARLSKTVKIYPSLQTKSYAAKIGKQRKAQ